MSVLAQSQRAAVAGQVSHVFGPVPPGLSWALSSIAVRVLEDGASAVARVYRGIGTSSPFLAGTGSGEMDTAACDETLYAGESLTVAFTDVTPATGTTVVTVNGTELGR